MPSSKLRSLHQSKESGKRTLLHNGFFAPTSKEAWNDQCDQSCSSLIQGDNRLVDITANYLPDGPLGNLSEDKDYSRDFWYVVSIDPNRTPEEPPKNKRELNV